MAMKREKFRWGVFSDKAAESLLRSTHKINIWQGSVRSGKTISSIVRWMQYVASVPGHYNLLMVGKTERALKRNILDVIITMVGPKNARYSFGTGEFILFGRVIYVVGASDERAQEKIRGVSLGGAYCDEISLYPESFFRMLSTRLSEPGAKMFCTTNPDSPYHYIKTDYIDREDQGVCKTFHFTIDDNPNLNPGYVEQIKREFSGLWYDRFILGKWVMAEGAVYDMWDEKRFCRDVKKVLSKKKKDQFRHYVVGVDYGTSNPTAFLMIGFDSFDGPKYVVKEYYHSGKLGRQKTDAEYCAELKKFCEGYPVTAVVVDPAAASFKVELRNNGIQTRDADNSKLDGIRFVATMLNNDALVVDNSCHSLRREFTAYLWDEKAQKRGIDEPLKEHDHALDALRYALYTVFGKGRGGILGGIRKK